MRSEHIKHLVLYPGPKKKKALMAVATSNN